MFYHCYILWWLSLLISIQLCPFLIYSLFFFIPIFSNSTFLNSSFVSLYSSCLICLIHISVLVHLDWWLFLLFFAQNLFLLFPFYPLPSWSLYSPHPPKRLFFLSSFSFLLLLFVLSPFAHSSPSTVNWPALISSGPFKQVVNPKPHAMWFSCQLFSHPFFSRNELLASNGPPKPLEILIFVCFRHVDQNDEYDRAFWYYFIVWHLLSDKLTCKISWYLGLLCCCSCCCWTLLQHPTWASCFWAAPPPSQVETESHFMGNRKLPMKNITLKGPFKEARLRREKWGGLICAAFRKACQVLCNQLLAPTAMAYRARRQNAAQRRAVSTHTYWTH